MVQYLIAAIVDIIVAIIAITRKRSKARHALVFVALCLASWSMELFFLSAIRNLDLLDPLFRITRVGMFFIPPACALLCWRLLGSHSISFRNVVVAPSFLISMLLGIANTSLWPSVLRPVEAGYLPQPDFIYLAFVANFLFSITACAVFVMSVCRQLPQRDRRRIHWLIFAIGLAGLGGAVSIFMMPSDSYLSKLVGTATNIAIITSLLYATFQHNVVDFNTAFSAGLTRALLLALFGWLFSFLAIHVVDDLDSPGGILAMLVFVVLALEGYPVVLRWMAPGARKYIAGSSFDFGETVRTFHQRLSDLVHINERGALVMLDERTSRFGGLCTKQVQGPASMYSAIIDLPPLCCWVSE